jgi:two-component system NarL family response regulator
MKPVSVLLADDHALVRLGLVQLVERDPRYQVVAQACNGREAVEAYQRLRPGLVLMDLMMPEMGGIEATCQIRLIDPKARVIILTSSDGEGHVYRGLQAGACAYLLKDAPERQVGECLAAVAEGRRFLPPDIAAKLALRIEGNQLSPREQDILHHLSEGLCNKLIARASGISEGTVKCHIRNIFSKMGVSTRTEAVSEAMKRGLVDLHQNASIR